MTAPKPISQHIVITHAPAMPVVDVEATPAPSTRHTVPKHLLKHHFLPLGAASSDVNIQRPAHAMEVDVDDGLGTQADAGGKKAELMLPLEETQTPKNKTPRSLQKSTEKSRRKRQK